MALGGGTFLAQNKLLPGAYINFVSAKKATATLSDRGYVALGLTLDFGIDNEIFEVTSGDFIKNSLAIFGYDYTHEKLKGLRDLFKNAKTLYAYKLNSDGVKASCAYGTAKHSGIRGNDISVIIQPNIDDTALFDIITMVDMTKVDVQTVATMDILKDNDFIVWNRAKDLAVTAKTPLTGGTNGTAVTAANHQMFLNKIESYAFNAIGVCSEDATLNGMYSQFCKRLRDEQGAKFQAVTWNNPFDYEGVVNVKNEVVSEDYDKSSLVYYVTGIIGSCEINKSNLNKKYDGEFTIKADFTQRQLENAIKNGEFVFHKVGDSFRVLQDINSLVTETDTKNEIFKDNQTIRVVDQIANDIAVLFNTKYLGVVPNDKAGRISLWSDIVKHHEQLEILRAIEDFKDTDIEVLQGDSKKSVVVNDYITVVNAMAKLYMSVTVA